MRLSGKSVKRVLLWAAAILVIALIYCGWRFGPLVMSLWREGFFEKTQMRAHQGTSEDNLKSLHTAMILYHDSEGQFPAAIVWMDAIRNRLKVADMKEEEALKKLVNPMIQPPVPGSYGYAMNDAVGGRYKDDVPGGGKTVLIFDSNDARWNAHGDPTALAPKPARPGGNLAITVDGTILRLK